MTIGHYIILVILGFPFAILGACLGDKYNTGMKWLLSITFCLLAQLFFKSLL
jgi:hypothetical protein